jgi:hypothetical protein
MFLYSANLSQYAEAAAIPSQNAIRAKVSSDSLASRIGRARFDFACETGIFLVQPSPARFVHNELGPVGLALLPNGFFRKIDAA